MRKRSRCSNVLRSLIIVASLFSFSVIDVSARTLFDSWTIDNELPQNSVYSIRQTRDGYLWFTTLNGIVRYDGARFTVFDKNNSSGINGNRFTTLHEDRAGTLWIGNEENGLTRYKDGEFTSYETNLDDLYNRIFAIQEEHDGSLLLLTEGGLARWRDESLVPLSSEEHSKLGIGSDRNVFAKEIQWNGGLAFAHAAGLSVIRGGHLTSLATADGLSSIKINSLHRDARGDLWVGTEDAGLNRLRDGKFTVYTTRDGLLANRMQITAVYADSRDILWFATQTEPGLFKLDRGLLKHYTSDDGLSGSVVRTIYEDTEGSIWVGTTDGGINRFREETITTFSTKDGLLSGNTYPILEDSAGTVWVGTWPGLNRYQNGKFVSYTKKDGLSSDTITALHEDREGYLWIGTYGGGVNRFKDGQFSPLEGFGGFANGILAIFQDRIGVSWFGTTAGLFRYKDKTLKRFTTDDGLPHLQVSVITEDRGGDLWLGTGGGLARFKDDAFTVYSEKHGLSSNHVRSLYQDEEGTLWVGTYDGGLNRFKDGRFTSYTTREGLFDNGVFQILDDGRGNFWMCSNRGVYRVVRRDLDDFAAGQIATITSIGYGRKDGMLSAECNGGSHPAGTKTSDGRLWFPTQQGVVVIDPAALRSNPLPPPVLIQDFIVENRKAAIVDGGVHVEPGQDRFEIGYAGLSFIRPEQMRFKYKLEGLDEGWVEAGAARSANYSYVPPGEYVFRVIAANSDGVWNEQGASLRILIDPPFWRTWWFTSLVAACLALLLVTGYRLRVSQLQNAHAAQEAFSRQLLDSQEQERRRIAGELHDGLGQSLLIIKNRAFLAATSMDDRETAEEQLDEISAAASHAIEEVREIAHDLHPYKLDRFGLTKTLEAILLQASRASAINFTSQIVAVDDLFPKQAETSIYRIVQESVNNIIKHSRATEANLSIRIEGGKMILRIQDNGRGIEPLEETNGKPLQGGFGLVGMSERVRMLGGAFAIESTPGNGTTIDVRLAIPGRVNNV